MLLTPQIDFGSKVLYSETLKSGIREYLVSLYIAATPSNILKSW